MLNAVEGWGKTTTGAHCPNPLILMSRGETGFVTLRGAGLAPDIDCANIDNWQQMLATIDHLVATDTSYKTVVLDALGGFERMCHEYVCRRDFDGDWGEKGFSSFHKGYDMSVGDWLILLSKLDQLRSQRGIMVLILSHVKVKTFKNPLGPDFDRYAADCHDKTWGATHKWADAVFFGNYMQIVDGGKTGKQAQKGKGIGGDARVLCTQRRDSYDAKNRYGMEAEIQMPDDPAQMWATIWAAMTKEAKTNG